MEYWRAADGVRSTAGNEELLIYLTRAVPTTMEMRNLTSRGILIGKTRLRAAVSEGDPKRRDEDDGPQANSHVETTWRVLFLRHAGPGG